MCFNVIKGKRRPLDLSLIHIYIRLTITWEHNVLPYGMTCTDRIATVNHGRKTVQIRPEKTFSKNFEKRVDETGILLYTKQVVSDESSKTTTT